MIQNYELNTFSFSKIFPTPLKMFTILICKTLSKTTLFIAENVFFFSSLYHDAFGIL